MVKFWAKKAFGKRRQSGWKKGQSATTRRRHLVKKHRGNLLKAARSALALSNVTRDTGTKRAARADALALFARARKRKRKR